MSVTEQPFGQTADGTKETLLTCTNASGNQVKLTTYGARIVAVTVPDRAGQRANVTLGFDKLEPYLVHKCFLGTTTGRFANRIAKGKFKLDGAATRCWSTMAPMLLHGGLKGFDKQHWTYKTLTTADATGVEFKLHSPDGDQGYPGAMDVRVTYTWSNDNALSIDYTATTDKPTILNLTNHAYWNLSGRGSILDDVLTIAADKYLPTDDTSIPLGESAPVKGTVMDFTTPHVMGERMDALKKPPLHDQGLRSLLRAARAGRHAGLGGPRRGSAQRPDDGAVDDRAGRAALLRQFSERGRGQRRLQSVRGILPRDPALSRFAESARFSDDRAAAGTGLSANDGPPVRGEVAVAAARKGSAASPAPSAKANLDALMRFWRRAPFHDRTIDRIVFANSRLVVTLEEYILVLTRAADFKSGVAELPTAWLYEAIIEKGSRFSLKVETEDGDFSATCGDFRLLRTQDMAILIPPVDG